MLKGHPGFIASEAQAAIKVQVSGYVAIDERLRAESCGNVLEHLQASAVVHAITLRISLISCENGSLPET